MHCGIWTAVLVILIGGPEFAVAAASDSTRARTLFTTEFGCGVRLGPEIEVGGDPENRATALWDFGPIFRISNNDAAGLLGHISYAGPDNPRAGIMVRWRHFVADRKSLEISGGLAEGGEGGSAIIMGTLNYRDVWLPTLLIQFPTGEESKEPRVFPSFKMGSSAGLLLGTMVPLIVFVAVFVGISSAS